MAELTSTFTFTFKPRPNLLSLSTLDSRLFPLSLYTPNSLIFHTSSALHSGGFRSAPAGDSTRIKQSRRSNSGDDQALAISSIRSATARLVDEPQIRVGVVSKKEALQMNEAADLDLTKAFAVPRRKMMALISSIYIFSRVGLPDAVYAQQPVVFREYIDTFDGYSFNYPKNWIQVRGAGADIFFRDPFVLDENLSLEISSPSSSTYESVKDLGPPEEAGRKVLRQYLTEFMSTRIGVRRQSNVLSTSSRVADDGKLYYQVEVNIKSYANSNELAVMPQDRPIRLEWDRRYLSVLGVENNRLYELRIQTPESVFAEEEDDIRRVMESFRVNKVAA